MVKLILGMLVPWTPLLPVLIAIKLEKVEQHLGPPLGAAYPPMPPLANDRFRPIAVLPYPQSHAFLAARPNSCDGGPFLMAGDPL